MDGAKGKAKAAEGFFEDEPRRRLSEDDSADEYAPYTPPSVRLPLLSSAATKQILEARARDTISDKERTAFGDKVRKTPVLPKSTGVADEPGQVCTQDDHIIALVPNTEGSKDIICWPLSGTGKRTKIPSPKGKDSFLCICPVRHGRIVIGTKGGGLLLVNFLQPAAEAVYSDHTDIGVVAVAARWEEDCVMVASVDILRYVRVFRFGKDEAVPLSECRLPLALNCIKWWKPTSDLIIGGEEGWVATWTHTSKNALQLYKIEEGGPVRNVWCDEKADCIVAELSSGKKQSTVHYLHFTPHSVPFAPMGMSSRASFLFPLSLAGVHPPVWEENDISVFVRHDGLRVIRNARDWLPDKMRGAEQRQASYSMLSLGPDSNPETESDGEKEKKKPQPSRRLRQKSEDEAGPAPLHSAGHEAELPKVDLKRGRSQHRTPDRDEPPSAKAREASSDVIVIDSEEDEENADDPDRTELLDDPSTQRLDPAEWKGWVHTPPRK